MEWSKDKTLKLIELLQLNPNLWNPSLCDTRRDKQKRKEELRSISTALNISLADATKKIQHLRTQYNRESAKEARATVEEPHEKYVSNWYAFEYLHFLKDTNKPFRVLRTEEQPNGPNRENPAECKLVRNVSPPITEQIIGDARKSGTLCPPSYTGRDDFTVFGEYVANELRTLKGEKNLIVAKKKIHDVIFEVKMGLMTEPREIPANVYTHVPSTSSLHGTKIYTNQELNATHIETIAHSPPTSMGEIIINSACHYSNFKVDTQ